MSDLKALQDDAMKLYVKHSRKLAELAHDPDLTPEAKRRHREALQMAYDEQARALQNDARAELDRQREALLAEVAAAQPEPSADLVEQRRAEREAQLAGRFGIKGIVPPERKVHDPGPVIPPALAPRIKALEQAEAEFQRAFAPALHKRDLMERFGVMIAEHGIVTEEDTYQEGDSAPT